MLKKEDFTIRLASYSYLSDSDWQKKIELADTLASSCELCPRKCKVNRFYGECGFCGAPGKLVISSIFPHHGEEPPFSATNGSGTVFFSYCTLKCCFCQNYQISHEYEGQQYSHQELASKMISLQEQGCHNINLVTATHFLPWIIRALHEASKKGLNIPLIYNCGGYELPGTIALLGGIVDIYLPDMKYGSNLQASLYSRADDYVEINRIAIREMFRQVGPLRCDEAGVAYRGLCIRHLVLPNDQSSSYEISSYLQSVFDPQDITISLMAQYKPMYKSADFSLINNPVTSAEYESVKQSFLKAGFDGFYQEVQDLDNNFLINFKKRKEEPLTGAPCTDF